MPYYEDTLARLGIDPSNPICHDIFSRQDKLSTPSMEELITMFPDLSKVSNPSIAYAPVIMCHSAPSFNKRGRGFIYNVLKNSVHTITDSLVNIEHNMKDNGIRARGDHICGNMKSFYIPPPVFKETANNKIESNIFGTDEPIPVYSLLALYMRHSMLKDILEEHVEKNNWFVSMECASNILESSLYYNGEVIPIKEADKGILDCIQKQSMVDYKGKPVKLLLGGLNGEVDFWGIGLTKKPADEGSNILNLFCANQVRSRRKESASYMPLKTYVVSKKNNSLNDPEKLFDNLVHEAASIIPIGETEAAEDGHRHDILTDGTIMPFGGHTHYLSKWEIAPGTNPSFTGIVSDYETYIKQDDREFRISHNHLININLRKKIKGQKEEETEVTSTDTASSTTNILEEHMPKFLDTLKNGLKELKGKVKDGEEKTVDQILSNLASVDIEKEIADEVDTVIAGKIEGGELVKKDEVEKKVDEAVKAKEKELNDAAEAEKKKQEVIALRLKQLTDAGVDIEIKIGKEGSQKTIKEIVSAMDIADDTQFNIQLDVFIKAFAKKEEHAKVPEAASIGKKIIVVGGGVVTTENDKGEKISKKIIGKNAITSV